MALIYFFGISFKNELSLSNILTILATVLSATIISFYIRRHGDTHIKRKEIILRTIEGIQVSIENVKNEAVCEISEDGEGLRYSTSVSRSINLQCKTLSRKLSHLNALICKMQETPLSMDAYQEFKEILTDTPSVKDIEAQRAEIRRVAENLDRRCDDLKVQFF